MGGWVPGKPELDPGDFGDTFHHLSKVLVFEERKQRLLGVWE